MTVTPIHAAKIANAQRTVAAAVAREREQLTQGICPRTDKRLMSSGALRPACVFCDCGESA